MKTHVVSRIAQKMKGPDYDEVSLYLDLLNEADEKRRGRLHAEYLANVSLVADTPPVALLKLAEGEQMFGTAKKQWEIYNSTREQVHRFKAFFHLFGEVKCNSMTADDCQRDRDCARADQGRGHVARELRVLLGGLHCGTLEAHREQAQDLNYCCLPGAPQGLL